MKNIITILLKSIKFIVYFFGLNMLLILQLLVKIEINPSLKS